MVTKCIDPAEFDRVNHGQTALFADTLLRLGMVPHRFIFVSTLSVFGAIHEHDFQPIRETDTPQPNTAYGRSKLEAERYLQGLKGLPVGVPAPERECMVPANATTFLMVAKYSEACGCGCRVEPPGPDVLYM